MRLSRMLLIAVLAVLASLMPAASPALAQSPPGTVEHSCNMRVCLTVTVESATELYVKANAEYHGATCGYFEATVATPQRTFVTDSSCTLPPSWYTGVAIAAGSSGTVSVRFFSNPPTPGQPLVHF